MRVMTSFSARAVDILNMQLNSLIINKTDKTIYNRRRRGIHQVSLALKISFTVYH